MRRFTTIKLVAQTLVVISLLLTPYTSLAISNAIRNSIKNGSVFYSKEKDACSETDTASTLPTALNGNDNIEKAFRYYTGKGLTAEQSAAIVGNFQQESNVDPARNQDGGGVGRGIAQWSVDGRWKGVIALAKTQGKSELDLGVQLDYSWQELHSTHTKAFNALLAARTIDDMVKQISELYEVAGKPEMPKRIAYAKAILVLYGGSAATPAVASAKSMYMIGDSITVGIRDAGVANLLKAAGIDPVTINAAQSRGITQPGDGGAKPGIDALDDDKATIKAAGMIFVGLGTNPGGTISQTTWGNEIDTFVDKIRTINPTAPIYWLNVVSPAITDRAARNTTLAQHATTKNFQVIDATKVALDFTSSTLHPKDYKPLSDFVSQLLLAAPITAPGSSTACDNAITNGTASEFIDGFAIYNQNDSQWSGLPYGTSTIGESGCGPSAMAMAVTALTGKPVLPPEVATYAASMYVPGKGSSHQIAPFVAAHWRLKAIQVGADVAKITQVLLGGGLVVAPGHGSDPFTSGGHYIVIRGVTAEGKWKVGDSGHSDTSDKDWDPQQLVSQMHSGGVYGIFK